VSDAYTQKKEKELEVRKQRKMTQRQMEKNKVGTGIELSSMGKLDGYG